MQYLKNMSSQKGQALLIVVLVMVVALTVTLSVVSRAVVNLRTTQEQANSQKALAAAEAGIEQTIKNNTSIGNGSFTNTTFTTSIATLSGTSSFLVNGGNLITKNDGVYIWLSPYTGNPATQWQQKWNGTINIYWGDSSGDNNNAALEVAVISGGSVDTANIKRYAFDPYDTRKSSNNFNDALSKGTYNVAGKTFKYQASITVANGMLIRVIPIYQSAYLSAGSSPNTPLPDQGRVITSTGISDTTQRKVTVFQGYPELPAEFFPYTLLEP